MKRPIKRSTVFSLVVVLPIAMLVSIAVYSAL